MNTLLSAPLVSTLLKDVTLRTGRLIDAGIDPQLAVILIGDDPDSLKYISIKSKRAKEAGIIVSVYHMESGISFKEVAEVIAFLAEDVDVHGIILQLPLPDYFTPEQTDQLLALVPSNKDVDGLRGEWRKQKYQEPSMADLLLPRMALLPPMICSVVSLLEQYSISLREKKVILVGAGRLVGAPLFTYLSSLDIDVQNVDEETEGILDITSQADILISGTGQPDLITYQWVKPGAVVIDCASDVHMDSVEQVASAIAPSIGGVGPLTVAWLLHNCVQAASNQYPNLI